MKDKVQHQPRDNKGQFDFDNNWDRLCKCGHTLGIHAAPNESGKRPCFNEDRYIKGATGEACDCKHFKLKKR